jgi:hypothetical protein
MGNTWLGYGAVYADKSDERDLYFGQNPVTGLSAYQVDTRDNNWERLEKYRSDAHLYDWHVPRREEVFSADGKPLPAIPPRNRKIKKVGQKARKRRRSRSKSKSRKRPRVTQAARKRRRSRSRSRSRR